MTDLLIFVAVMWPTASLIGWASIRDAGYRPFNWRIFLGPVVYGHWRDRRFPDRP
jgi:hypothetical protein